VAAFSAQHTTVSSGSVRRLIADFMIEIGRLPEGDDPIAHFTDWLTERGAPSKIATGFDEPTAGESE
jgi:hypothetical protein